MPAGFPRTESPRLHCGAVGPDGRIFWAYRKDGVKKWASPETFKRWQEAKRIQTRARRAAGLLVKVPAQHAADVRAYRKRNPHRGALEQMVRNDRLRSSERGDSEFIRQFYLTRDRLTQCTGFPWHVDHVRPLCKGGAHHEANLQVVPAGINLRKGRR